MTRRGSAPSPTPPRGSEPEAPLAGADPGPDSGWLRYDSAHIGAASGGSGTANAFSTNEMSV
jgi:hypothetical protein